MSGPGAGAYLQRLAANDVDRPVGTIVYTAMLGPRGGDHVRPHDHPRGRRALLGRHRRRRRQARPRVDAPQPAADGCVSLRRPHLGLCCVGVWGRSRASSCSRSARTTWQRGVPVHDRARLPHRLRAGPRAADLLRRRARLGDLRADRVRRRALGHAVGRRQPLGAVACGGARTTRCASRRATASGARTSTRSTTRTRRASAGRAAEEGPTSSAATRPPRSRSAASSASCAAWSSTTRAVLVGKEPLLDGDRRSAT